MNPAQIAYQFFISVALVTSLFVMVAGLAITILTWPLLPHKIQTTSRKFLTDPLVFIEQNWKLLTPIAAVLTFLLMTIPTFFANLTALGFWEPYTQPLQMDAAFNMAVAYFEYDGNESEQKSAERLAITIYNTLDVSIGSQIIDISISVAGPRQIGRVTGKTQLARARNAERIASQTNADLVVYGVISEIEGGWELNPEFYVSDRDFFRAQEITDEHKLGKPITLLSLDSSFDTLHANREFSERLTIFTYIVNGLAYYKHEDYQRASNEFDRALASADGDQADGLDVIYLLLGNAALKLENFVDAIGYYQESLAVNSDYSRSYVGSADAYYRLALVPFDENKDRYNVDFGMLDQADLWLDKATRAADRPKLADIETKIHFLRGQIEFVRVWAQQSSDFSSANTEFMAVINAYEHGENPRVQDFAAEAHARLGLINFILGNTAAALAEYQVAISLLPVNSERRTEFENRVRKILDLQFQIQAETEGDLLR